MNAKEAVERLSKASLSPTGRIVALALIILSFPLLLFVDLYLTPWRVPTRILYVIPITVAARLFGRLVTVGVILAAVAFGILDAWLTGIDAQTEALAILGLVIIGLLSLLWTEAERRSAALAEERARLYEQEQRRAAELAESRARLMEFFSMVAHDLQSPLATISGYAQMLSRHDALPPAERERIASGVKSSVGRVVRLANDLLDASRVGAGRLEIQKGICDLVALSREAVEQRQPTAPRHRLVLVAPIERLEGRCDQDRLAQAIGNLIDNAIKYSPEGGEVRVRVERVDSRARVSVIDQGIGIAPEDVPLLFQPYVRLRRAPGTRGLGLGLYIVRGIVEAHGGTVTVQSELGRGSTFTIDLPLADPRDGDAQPPGPCWRA